MDAKYPLKVYLGLEGESLQALLRALNQAEEELAEALLSTNGMSEMQIRAQIEAVNSYQQMVWGSAEVSIHEGQLAAMEAARTMLLDYEREYFASIGLSADQMSTILTSEAFRASQSIATMVARERWSRRALSDQVWKTSRAARSRMERDLNAAIIRGLTGRDLANAVAKYIRADVPGGVRYAAMRLARTEINNAFHAATNETYRNSEVVEQVEWNLSGSHPAPDRCDELRDAGPYPLDEVPDKPHPQCFCFTTPLLPEPDDFLAQMMAEEDGDGGSQEAPQDPIDFSDDEKVKQRFDDYQEWIKNNPGEAFGDQMLSDVYRYMGYDTSLPEIVDSIPDDAIKLLRGLSGDDAEQFANQFLNGKHFAGQGLFGNGSYTASTLEVAERYAKNSGVILELGLKPDARIIDAGANMREIWAQMDPLKVIAGESPLFDDLGSSAALMNYDAIRVTLKDGSYYFVILNREALYAVRR